MVERGGPHARVHLIILRLCYFRWVAQKPTPHRFFEPLTKHLIIHCPNRNQVVSRTRGTPSAPRFTRVICSARNRLYLFIRPGTATLPAQMRRLCCDGLTLILEGIVEETGDSSGLAAKARDVSGTLLQDATAGTSKLLPTPYPVKL